MYGALRDGKGYRSGTFVLFTDTKVVITFLMQPLKTITIRIMIITISIMVPIIQISPLRRKAPQKNPSLISFPRKDSSHGLHAAP